MKDTGWNAECKREDKMARKTRRQLENFGTKIQLRRTLAIILLTLPIITYIYSAVKKVWN